MHTERKTLKPLDEKPHEKRKCYNSRKYKRQQQAILFARETGYYITFLKSQQEWWIGWKEKEEPKALLAGASSCPYSLAAFHPWNSGICIDKNGLLHNGLESTTGWLIGINLKGCSWLLLKIFPSDERRKHWVIIILALRHIGKEKYKLTLKQFLKKNLLHHDLLE